VPAATEVVPSHTPEPGVTPLPDTPVPADTAVPTDAPADPTASPAPVVLNPLTGLPVSDPSVLDRRPINIKIANFPRSVRAWQSGLTQADNVWEHYAEGGTTRFTGIFLSQAPDHIGNVRSARLLDIHLGYAYDSVIVASGSSSGTLQRMREAGIYDRLIAEATGYQGCPVLCREEAAEQTPHKIFTSLPAIWDLVSELGLDSHQPLEGYHFGLAVPDGGEAAPTIHIDWQLNNTVAEWRYDPGAQQYDRWIDTDNMPELARHIDNFNGQPISTQNVVILFASYVPSNIWEEDGGARHYSYDVLLTGEGGGLLFRDGRMWSITWQRPEVTSGLPRLLDANGQAIALRSGQTWFMVMDPDSPQTFEGGVFQARSKVPDASALPTATP
jgi:hypothetical protein